MWQSWMKKLLEREILATTKLQLQSKTDLSMGEWFSGILGKKPENRLTETGVETETGHGRATSIISFRNFFLREPIRSEPIGEPRNRNRREDRNLFRGSRKTLSNFFFGRKSFSDFDFLRNYPSRLSQWRKRNHLWWDSKQWHFSLWLRCFRNREWFPFSIPFI